MAQATLSPEEVREYLRDKTQNNHLLEGEEFNNTIINLAMDLAINEFNLMAPASAYTNETFPNKAILMSGTLYKLFLGQSALLARNTMQYSDGGITIPIEERFQLYTQLAAMCGEDFHTSSRMVKIQINMNDLGWGQVQTDYANFPIW
jgi:hypothetical protein